MPSADIRILGLLPLVDTSSLAEDGGLKPAYTVDGLHLTREGYRVLIPAIMDRCNPHRH